MLFFLFISASYGLHITCSYFRCLRSEVKEEIAIPTAVENRLFIWHAVQDPGGTQLSLWIALIEFFSWSKCFKMSHIKKIVWHCTGTCAAEYLDHYVLRSNHNCHIFVSIFHYEWSKRVTAALRNTSFPVNPKAYM